MIRFGPAGIPLSCKGRTLRDGIEDVHTLGLNAMEVQLVRANVVERVAGEEEIGLTPRDIQEELVVEINRGPKKDAKRIFNLNTKIEKGDVLISMVSGIAKDHEQLKRLGALARDLDVKIALHTPYYMDFISDDDITQRSMDSVIWGGMLVHELGGGTIITHLGLYGDVEPSAALKKVASRLKELTKVYRDNNIDVRIGIEPSGRQEVVGSVEEILQLCNEVPGVVPVLNFPHLHARGNGSLKTKEDFQKLFDETAKYFNGDYYAHFSGVEHEEGNEIRYTPIKKGDLKFEPLAECILDNTFSITIISGSPLLEHDAMYMKVILERILARRKTKPQKAPAKAAPSPKAKAAAKPAKKPAKPAKKPSAKPKAKPKAKPAAKKAPTKKPVKKGAKKKPSKPAKKPAKPAKKPAPKPKAKPKAKPAAKKAPTMKPAKKAAKKKPSKQSKKPAKKKKKA